VGETDAELYDALRGLLPGTLTEAYAALRDRGPREPQLGGDGLDSELISRGLAYLRSGRERPLLWATEPVAALAGTLADVEQDLTGRHQRVAGGYGVLAELQRRRAEAAGGQAPSDLVRVLTDRDEIAGLSGTLANHARSDYMAIRTLGHDVPLTEAAVCPPPAAVVRRGVRCRTLYTADHLTHPVGALTVARCRRAGEQARTLPRLPMKLLLADEHLALVGLTPAGACGALLVRSSALLAALRQYFEVLWAQATPVADGEEDPGPLGPKERAVLALMAHGLKDDAIARRLDMSVRTVRRYVSALLDHLNVSTRFAAGAAAQRQGLLE
jgi:DNA-binding CsgD family transcriptional regulator